MGMRLVVVVVVVLKDEDIEPIEGSISALC